MLYPTGQWFYFPSTILIKSTLGFLLLLVLTLTAAHLWREERARELLFLLLPAALYHRSGVLARGFGRLMIRGVESAEGLVRIKKHLYNSAYTNFVPPPVDPSAPPQPSS